MATIQERAKQSATSIINWCLDVDVQDAEEDDNFVTSEIMRAMKWQKDNDIDKACEWLSSKYENGFVILTENTIKNFCKAMEE